MQSETNAFFLHPNCVFYINIINIENLYPPAMEATGERKGTTTMGLMFQNCCLCQPVPVLAKTTTIATGGGQKSFHGHFENMNCSAVPNTNQISLFCRGKLCFNNDENGVIIQHPREQNFHLIAAAPSSATHGG